MLVKRHRMEFEYVALDSFSFLLGLKHPCFTFYSFYGEFLPLLAAISHLSIQCDKTGDCGIAQQHPESLSCPTVVFLNVRFTILLNFYSHIASVPAPNNYRIKMKHKLIPTNYDFPLLNTFLPFTKG